MGNWYKFLQKPPFTPPAIVFTVAWAILYFLIFLSFIFYVKTGITKEKALPIIFFIIQLLLNFAWSPVFFKMHNMILGLILIILMIIFVLLTIITFYKSSKLASFLLIPYLLWLFFAAYLNLEFIRLN